MKGTNRRFGRALMMLTVDARRNVTMFEIRSYFWPKIKVADVFIRLVETKMAECVVCQTKYLLLNATI
jgi:hypothetical protein